MQISLDHHHILLYCAVFILSLLGIYGIESRVADKERTRADAAEAKSQLIQAQNKDFQTQVAQQVQQLVLQNTQLQQANQVLSSEIASTNALLAAQKTKDKSLPPDQLAARIVTLVPGGSISVQPNGYLFDQPEAVAVAQTLEEVPALESNVQKLESENANLTTEVTNDVKTLDLEKQSHAHDITADQAKLNAVNAELSQVKADCRKSKFKWFGAGVVVGFVARHFVGF